MTDWQPIATAPIDTYILIAATPDWVGEAIVYDSEEGEGYRYEWGDGRKFHQKQVPTHWMPLPLYPMEST
jgi:hypothetical protein